MSSPELEAFEATEEDYLNEFNPDRKRFRMSKHQAVYGIWADEDSDNERPGLGGSRRKKKDYSSPIGFISGGIKQGDKVTKKTEEAGGTEDSDSESEDPKPGFGQQDESSTGGTQTLGSFAQNKRVSSFASDFNPDMGHWEKHTKGIGQRLLEKMGHVKGRGLGKNLQGISTPVEAFKRKGKGTIGFHGTERTNRSLVDFPVDNREEEEEQNFKQQLHQWRKGDGEKKKKPKYVYKTAGEVIAKGGKKKVQIQSELSKVKVIDMTGKEQRVLSGYHAISHKHDRPDEEEEIPYSQTQEKKSFDMPELLHNLDLLVDMAEDEILQNDKKLKYEEDLIVNLKFEKEKMDTVCEQESKQLEKLKTILGIVESCENRMKPNASDPITLDECAKLFSNFQDEYYEEYKIYELSSLAIAIVFPLMKKEFEDWNPLQNPTHGIDTMKQWKDIIGDQNRHFDEGDKSMDPYERLLWEVWMPHIRNTVNNKWSVRNCDPMIEVLEDWMPILPPWIMANVQDQLIFPKLQREVDDWNPLTDTVPIHAWLHPWLPLTGEKLEPLYAPIRHKLANALNSWHPSDPSAKMILQPWLGVFKKGHIDAFLVKHIVPKLGLCMQEFVINPHQQHLETWNWVMSWVDMIPHASMVAILEKGFFPKWLDILMTWLSSHPNYDEVTKWYMGWKTMFPESLLGDPTIKEQFNRALGLMNRAVSGNFQPGARENMAYFTSTARREFDQVPAFEQPPPPPPPPQPMRGASVPSSSVPVSFKDLLEQKAAEKNILFMPIPNKFHEAKQVYCLGDLQIYLDRGVIFMFETNMFVPVSLQTVLDRASR